VLPCDLCPGERHHIAPGLQSFALYAGLAVRCGEGCTLIGADGNEELQFVQALESGALDIAPQLRRGSHGAAASSFAGVAAIRDRDQIVRIDGPPARFSVRERDLAVGALTRSRRTGAALRRSVLCRVLEQAGSTHADRRPDCRDGRDSASTASTTSACAK
jgi:hypothetical protein